MKDPDGDFWLTMFPISSRKMTDFFEGYGLRDPNQLLSVEILYKE